jgi:hypothetical protein
MSDADLTLDFSDVKAASGGFAPVPAGWYNVVVSDWSENEVSGKSGKGKLPVGTAGTTYEVTILDGPYEDRKFWPNFWHHATSLPYWKNFLLATGKFTEDELGGALDPKELRERPQGAELQVRVKIQRQTGYDDRNQPTDYAPLGTNPVVSETDTAKSSGGSKPSFLP